MSLLEIQDGRHCDHLEILLFASSPELKGQLTRNLVGSIGVTCRSKITKIVLIGNPRWQSWCDLENLFLFFSPELKGQLTRNLVLVLLFVALWFILRGDLLYVLLCVFLFLCFSVL